MNVASPASARPQPLPSLMRLNATPPTTSRQPAGRLRDGRDVEALSLAWPGRCELRALTLGGIVTHLQVPDRHGHLANVVLGFDELAGYDGPHPGLGIIVGRVANRIAGASFELDGRRIQLDANDRTNALHGGREGFGAKLWAVDFLGLDARGWPSLRLALHSPDGDQGYPGALQCAVTYTLSPEGHWHFICEASSNQLTVVNLTQHSYFNLSGHDGPPQGEAKAAHSDARHHHLQIAASHCLAVDERLIPTDLLAVDGTPFDFRQAARVSERRHQAHPQLQVTGGFDHHWVLDTPSRAGQPVPAARLSDSESGRSLTLLTSEPGLQFYAGNFLDGRVRGHGGRALTQGCGLCLEPQHAPDSVHHPDWPSIRLAPGDVYRHHSVFAFGTDA